MVNNAFRHHGICDSYIQRAPEVRVSRNVPDDAESIASMYVLQ